MLGHWHWEMREVEEKDDLKLPHSFHRVKYRVFSGPNTPHLSVFSPNAGKYGPEKLRF